MNDGASHGGGGGVDSGIGGSRTRMRGWQVGRRGGGAGKSGLVAVDESVDDRL